MPNPIEVAMAASAALEQLQKSGSVGYTEGCKVLLDTTLNLEETEGYSVNALIGHIGLTVGKKYTVTLDVGTFECECLAVEDYIALAAVTETGEQIFAVLQGYEDGTAATVVYDYTCGTHCTIAIPETIHPIDKKYLPETLPKIIDLSQYKLGNNNNTIADAILMAFALGGQSGNFDGDFAKLWSDVDTNRSIRIIAPATMGDVEYTIQSDEVTVAYVAGSPALIAYNFMMYFNSQLTSVKVNIGEAGQNRILLIVVVEPVTMPPST